VPVLDDDRGHPVRLDEHPHRVVSLVPSLTEALAVTVPDRLVGATVWCTHPERLDVTRVRGTKNPDHRAIVALRPDLVVANQEENRRVDVERLRSAGVPVWVTVTESVDQALGSLRRLLVDVLGTDEPGWLATASAEWGRPADLPAARVVVPIWRDPWMVVGSRTFSGDLVARLGLDHLFAGDHDRYPKVALAELVDRSPDLVLLPDEPYAFGAGDGPEAFPGIPTALVSGRDLTWYGPSMATSRAALTARIRSALGVS
jgi:ABC-type Fe3+-hydroxamate transport system substrate-binding protein